MITNKERNTRLRGFSVMWWRDRTTHPWVPGLDFPNEGAKKIQVKKHFQSPFIWCIDFPDEFIHQDARQNNITITPVFKELMFVIRLEKKSYRLLKSTPRLY